MSDDKSLIDLFEENELNVSRLYRIYSEKFTADRLFWQKLSKEESDHAEMIRSLRGRPEAEFAENKFTRGVVTYVINFVKEQIEKAENTQISDLDAISAALRIEQSILEKKCFDFFKSSDKTLNEVMGKLGQETDKHLKMLQKEVGKLERKKS